MFSDGFRYFDKAMSEGSDIRVGRSIRSTGDAIGAEKDVTAFCCRTGEETGGNWTGRNKGELEL